MASSNDNVSMALFCDFENVALGVRDANYEKFDIKPVLERLLLKGSIVVKKAYCDWDRYKGFKSAMHEANFELIEIPHVRQSGKNSADIRMVVDALDLCYTKSHVNTFVIISGDSDFSPLVSKLRENAKKVIGVGVKQSTSDLLVANCDEFIFYDDLVRERRRADAAKRDTREGQGVKRTAEEEKRRREEMDKRRTQAVEMAVETFDALVAERGDTGKIWASVLKEAIKRRKPDFSESYYGFRTFGNLLEEARARGFLEFGRDEKSGAYVYRSSGVPALVADGVADGVAVAGDGAATAAALEAAEGAQQGRQEGGRNRGRNRGRDRRPFPNAGRVNDETSADLQLAQDENAYAQAEAEHAADDAAFAGHPDDAGLEQGGVAADDTVVAAVAVTEVTEGSAIAVAEEAVPSTASAAEHARRKQQKLPARAAKAAKLKARHTAAAGGSASAQPAPQAGQVAAQSEAAAVPEVAAGVAADDVADVAANVAANVAGETASRNAADAAPAAEAVSMAGMVDSADGVSAKPAAKSDKGRGRAPVKGRGGKGAARTAKPEANGQAEAVVQEMAATPAATADAAPQPVQDVAAAVPADSADASAAAAKPARKPSARGPRRPRKPDAKQGA